MPAHSSGLRALIAGLALTLCSGAAQAGAQQYEPLAASVRAALHEAVSDAVAPTLPTNPPRGTSSPTFTSMADMWQNMLTKPWPWSRNTVLPLKK